MEHKLAQKNRIKPIFAYFKESIKFYDIDQPLIAQIIFVIQLAVVFGGYVIARPYTEKFFLYYEQISNKFMWQIDAKNYDLSFLNSDLAINMINAFSIVMLIYFASKAIAYLFGIFFGAYYFMSLTRSDTTPAQRFSDILLKYPKLIIFNILFYAVFAVVIVLLFLAAGIASLIIPLFIVLSPLLPFAVIACDTLFIFKNLLIIEFDTGVFKNFKKSLDITKGCKRRIIVNGLWPVCLGLLLSSFSIGINNPLLSLFILAFFEVIVHLITQRLIALMFIDAASLERNDKKAKEVKNRG
ncbi:MAG: hypothetical protein GX227_00495 [Clostridiaceae bacterium]|jgi:hypothetical protein|nr:hypothetical protein [Clostridiaceae bacterium]